MLLTDSGHYLLPTDEFDTEENHDREKEDVVTFMQSVAHESQKKWNDVHETYTTMADKFRKADTAEHKRCEVMEKETE